MIEQVIYFALGCILTALAALAFAPFFWRRALRLTRDKLQLQVPLSMQEILAERDQLRAEFAVERLRIEQAMERVQAARALDMAESGRQSVRVTALTDELTALRHTSQAQELEIETLRRELSGSEAEAATVKLALNDAHARVDAVERDLALERIGHRRSRADGESLRGANAVLDARVAELETHAKKTEEGLRSRLEAAVAHATRHETSGVSLRHDLDEAKLRIRRLEQALQEAEGALEAGRERETGLQLQNSMDAGRVRGSDRLVAQTIEGLRAENAALEAALGAALRDRSAATPSEPGDAALRESIRALGVAIAGMARETRATDEGRDARPARRPAEVRSAIDAG